MRRPAPKVRFLALAGALAVIGAALVTASTASADGACYSQAPMVPKPPAPYVCKMIPDGSTLSMKAGNCIKYCGDGTTLANCSATSGCVNVATTACCTRIGIDMTSTTKTACATAGGTWWGTAGSMGRPLSCPEVGLKNLALPANGGVASASSYGSYNGIPYAPSAMNNGDRIGANFNTAGGGWQDSNPGTFGVFPDWASITFNAAKKVSEIDVFSLGDNFMSGVAPTPTMTFANWGLTSFVVEYWNGSAWVAAFNVTGNNLVWRKFVFATPVVTNQIRITINGSADGYSRIIELEAWGID